MERGRCNYRYICGNEVIHFYFSLRKNFMKEFQLVLIFIYDSPFYFSLFYYTKFVEKT